MLNDIDLARADLNLLVLFERVLEERHVGRAAAKLNLSPSAVSHGLRRLRSMFKDPLFLRTPRGVVPTTRASELAPSIADILMRIRSVVATTGAFEPTNSSRRFVLGVPEGATEVLLPGLVVRLQTEAAGIDIGIRELLPKDSARNSRQVWDAAIAGLDAREMDMALLPVDAVPARFSIRCLYEEDFIVAVRARHPFRRNPTLPSFCQMRHLLVSLTGDPFGFVDEALAEKGLSRRITVTAPNFMTALAMVAETDLLATLPRQLALRHARRFGVKCVEPPLTLPRFQISAVVPRVAMEDAGVSWLLDCLARVARETVSK